MKTRNGFILVLMMLAAIPLSLAACGDNDDDKTADTKQKLYVCGVGEGRRAAVGTEEVLFTEDNIKWFNVNTREIKFKTEPVTDEKLYSFDKIVFRLGNQVLFDVQGVSLIDSRVYTELVLCHGSMEKKGPEWGYYLYDCYPLQFASDERVKANLQKLAPQWDIFIRHLKSKGKLKR